MTAITPWGGVLGKGERSLEAGSGIVAAASNVYRGVEILKSGLDSAVSV